MLQIICSLDSIEYPEFPQEDLSSLDEIYRLDGTVEIFEGKNNTSEKKEDHVNVRKRKKKSGDNEESQKRKRKQEEEQKRIHQKIQQQQQFLREQRQEERRKEKELQQKERKLISMAKASEYRKAIAPNEMPMAFNFSEIKPMNKLPEKLPQNYVRIQGKTLFKKVLPESKPVKSLSKPTLKVIMPNVNSPLIGATDTLVINTFDIKTDLQPINSVANIPKKRRKLIELENIFSKIVENMEMTLTRRIQDWFSIHNLSCIKESSW